MQAGHTQLSIMQQNKKGPSMHLTHTVTMLSFVLQRAGMLAADGRCKTLDISADGYARAEACKALYLSLVPDTDQATHTSSQAPVAYIANSGVNTNGKSSGLAAPHGPSQQTLLSEVLRGAGLDPDQLAGLQLHANGTC